MDKKPKDSERPALDTEPFFSDPRFVYTWWNGERMAGSCLVAALVFVFLLPVVVFVANLILSWLVKE
jgi:hypothetical protein